MQYWDWITHFVHGDLGTSLQYQVPVSDLLGPSLVNSLKLAAVAFVLVVPLSILGGTIAGLRRGRADRPRDHGHGPVADRDPGVRDRDRPDPDLRDLARVAAGHAPPRPPGPTSPTQVKYLLLPSFALVLVLFGYIARITRSSMIESVDADYTRTAYLKGLSQRQVVGRHVLRNSLLPTIAVVATQVGYLIGGLLVIEKLFNYNGHRPADLHRRPEQGLPDAAERRHDRRHRLPRRHARSPTSSTRVFNPRIRFGAAE